MSGRERVLGKITINRWIVMRKLITLAVVLMEKSRAIINVSSDGSSDESSSDESSHNDNNSEIESGNGSEDENEK